MLTINTQAPDFTLPDQDGKMHSLSDYKGRKVILYFYPKDNTSGCTKQACSFGDLFPHFREKGVEILGVSKDSVASHKKFQEKFNLPFTLLSDTEKTVIPFATSGGSSIKKACEDLKAAYPEVNWKEGKLLNRVSKKDLEKQVNKQ